MTASRFGRTAVTTVPDRPGVPSRSCCSLVSSLPPLLTGLALFLLPLPSPLLLRHLPALADIALANFRGVLFTLRGPLLWLLLSLLCGWARLPLRNLTRV